MDPAHSDAFWTTGFAVFWLIVLVVVLVLAVFSIISIQNALNTISVENRKMPPNNVWLVLIPFFGIVWQFFVVRALADSLVLEFKKRNIKPDDDRPLFNLGIATCILFLILPYAPFGAITWTIFMVKLSRYQKMLEAPANVLDGEIYF